MFGRASAAICGAAVFGAVFTLAAIDVAQSAPAAAQIAMRVDPDAAEAQADAVYDAMAYDSLLAAAASGELDAMRALARRLRFGVDAPHDPAEARRWLGQASQRGDAQAITRLGVMRLLGEGGARSAEAAAASFRRAARLGEPSAAYDLAVLYARGEGVERDMDTARDWMRKALELGHPWAADGLTAMGQAR